MELTANDIIKYIGAVNENATCEDCWRKFFETLIEKGVGLNDHES